jgi:hypothetical protein
LVRKVIEDFIDEHPSILEMVDELGTSKATGTCEELLVLLRMRLGKALDTEDLGCGHARSRWRPGLVEGFIKAAGDPEAHLVGWLREGAPTGVMVEIPSCGIFPKVDKPVQAFEELQYYYARASPG